jgi:hypothetical protein
MQAVFGPVAFVAACSCAILVPACLTLLVPGCMLCSVTSGRAAGGRKHAALSRRPDHHNRCGGGRSATVQRCLHRPVDVPVWD